MKFAIVGAGAIGGFAGAQLARAGEEVALVDIGVQLRALQENGITVRSESGEYTMHPFATDDPAEIGPVDAVLVTVKAQDLHAVAPRLEPLLGPETAIIAAQNGIPWWYFDRHGGPLEGLRLNAVDPEGLLAAAIPSSRIVGCVIYLSTESMEPGVIRHVEGDRFSIGELDGSRSDRCKRISQALQKAGIRCPVRSRIRHDIWVKLIGNLAFNPISALTRATMDRMLANPETNGVIRAVMEEGAAVAAAVGVPLEITAGERMAGAARTGAHKTSTLQDLEAGRKLELDCITGAVVELAERVSVPVPHIRTLHACTKLLAAGFGLTR
jgi:2-dehydropantoate 2-reductase